MAHVPPPSCNSQEILALLIYDFGRAFARSPNSPDSRSLVMGSVILVPGVVQGMGRIERCEVLARITQRGNSRSYSEGFVLNAPEDLPDGEYVASFDGCILHTARERGLWFTLLDVSFVAA